MRNVLVTVIAALAIVGCGGPSQDAKEATADSAAPSDSAGAPVTTDMAPPDNPPPAASASASAAAATPPPAASGPTTLAGNLLGKEFKPLSAFAMVGAKPGTVLIEILDQPVSCGALPQTPGAQKLGVLLAWKEGSTDVKTLKGGKEPEAYVMSVNAQKKFDRKDWKATGTIAVEHAPKKGGDIGRIKLDTKQGKDTLTGEIDVKICGDLP